MDNREGASCRDVLSPSMQGMIINGGYVLLNEQDQEVDMDADLPERPDGKDTQNEAPVLRIRQIPPVTLPRVWTGYYHATRKRPLFCFLLKNKTTAEELIEPLRRFTIGGFTVAPFPDEGELEQALDDRNYVNQFDFVGMVCDAQAADALWRVRGSLIAKGILENHKTPFACAGHFVAGKNGRTKPQKPRLADGGVPATVDLALDPDQFCEQMILTLYYDERWYPGLAPHDKDVAQQADLDEEIRRQSQLESEGFYAGLNHYYTDYVRDFTRSFASTQTSPAPDPIRRVMMQNPYLSRSKLAFKLKDDMLEHVKKILDYGRLETCFAEDRVP